MKSLAFVVLAVGCGEVVKEPPPPGAITVAVTQQNAFVRQGDQIDLDVTITADNVAGGIQITATNLPAGVSLTTLDLDAGVTTGTLHLTADATATQGAAAPTFVATAVDDAATTGESDPIRLLVAGTPGSLDLSFDLDGMVIPELGGLSMVARGLVLTDKGVVVTGAVGSSPVQAITVRMKEDGSLDDSFGSGGFVSTGVGQFAEGIGLVADTDGSLIAAGAAGSANPSTEFDFGVFRYDDTGALVTSFGQSGVVSLDAGNNVFAEWHDVLLQPDGKIVVGGTTFNVVTGRALRYSAGGVQDASFANITESGVNVQGSTLQSDGKILFCGSLSSDFWLARYTTSGAHDAGFGTNGIVTTDFANAADGANGVVVVAGNKILVVGTSASKLALARYNANGSPDVTFGIGGKVTTTIPFESKSGAPPVVVGNQLYFVGERPTVDKHPAVARINIDDGSVDTTFGTLGASEIDFGIAGTQNNTGGFGLAVDADGRIIVGAEVGSTQRMAIARLWP